jgi:hypothetical protein
VRVLLVISSKPRIAVIRFENLPIAMATFFHQASRLGLEGKSLGISLLDGGPGGKGMLDMNMRWFLNMGGSDYSKDFANFNKKIKNNLNIWKENNVKFY